MTAISHSAIAARIAELAVELNGRDAKEVPRIEREVASLVELCGSIDKGHVPRVWSSKAVCVFCGGQA